MQRKLIDNSTNNISNKLVSDDRAEVANILAEMVDATPTPNRQK